MSPIVRNKLGNFYSLQINKNLVKLYNYIYIYTILSWIITFNNSKNQEFICFHNNKININSSKVNSQKKKK